MKKVVLIANLQGLPMIMVVIRAEMFWKFDIESWKGSTLKMTISVFVIKQSILIGIQN